jgi:Tfp pilus assembly protein PilX
MNRNKVHRKKHKKGFVLVLTVFVTMILATLIIVFLNITTIDLILVKNHFYSSRAYYIAEAGVSYAIDQIRLNGPLEDTQWENTFPPATSDKYNVSVSQNSTVINSIGLATIPNFSRALEVQISVSGSSPPYKVTINQWKEVIQ